MEFTFETIGTNTFLTYVGYINEFDGFSLKMLEHNEIEGVLPFSYIQENMKKKIRYVITSYETLESYIRRPLPLHKILNILESIARTALELDEYMLYMNGIVLEPAYMYTEIGTGNTRMVYLPVKKAENIDIFGFLRGLLGRVQYETPESAVCILKLSNDINSGEITSLRQFLDAMKGAKKECRVPHQKAVEIPAVEQPVLETQAPVKVQEPAFTVPVMQQPVEEKGEIQKKKDKKSFKLFGGEKKKKETSKQKIKDSKAVSPGFAIPGMEQSYSAPEASVIAGLPEPEIKADKPSSAETSAGKKGFSAFKKKKKPGADPKMQLEPVQQASTPVNMRNVPQKENEAEAAFDFGGTIILQPDDEVTVVEGFGTDERQGASYILRRANGQKMYLEQEITKIGRESAYVDFYIGDNLKIGRSHAEIIRKGQGYFIKDNHSKNHTYVNQRVVAGDELVKLCDGDLITLANEVFEYHGN